MRNPIIARRLVCPALVCVCVCSLSASGRADTIEVGPGDDVEAAINALMPGDELLLQDGMYVLDDAWHLTIDGTEQAPIVVRAKDGEHPHLHRPSADQNIVDFDHVRYAEWRGIEVSGGSAGLRLIDVSFMTIADCEVHDTADVAIAANSGSDYEGLIVRHNHIHDTGGTGEGMYIGCNDNSCQVHDSLFEGNHIHDTNGPDVSQGDGIEIKEGSYANVVRDNVIHDTGYPCIISYSTVGNGGPNVIERNLLWGCGDHAIQSAADAIIRNNVILGAAANGIANQPHQSGTPSNLVIVHNTILAPQNDGIVSSGITGSVLIANNAVYAQSGSAIRVSGELAGVTVRGNVGVGGVMGSSGGIATGDLAADFIAASYSNALPNDVFPKVGSALIASGSVTDVADDDFNGSARHGDADVGAYAFDPGGNPGAALAAAFKPTAGSSTTTMDAGTPSRPASDAGPTDSDAGSSGSSGNAGRAGSAGGAGGSGGKSSTAGSGAAGTDSAGTGHAAQAGAGTAHDDGGTGSADGDSGCSCRIAGRHSHAPGPWLAFAFALMAGYRGRRRFRTAKAPRTPNYSDPILLFGVCGALAVRTLLLPFGILRALAIRTFLLLLALAACSDDPKSGVPAGDAAPTTHPRRDAGASSPSTMMDAASAKPPAADAGSRNPPARDASSAPARDSSTTPPSPVPDAGAFTPNPMLTDLADETALDLGKFSCGAVPGEEPGLCGLTTDYSGFVYDPHHHAMLSFGGGHATTMTDSIHALDLGGTLQWSDLYAPTPCSAMTTDNLDADNGAWKSGDDGPYPRPVSTHTYDLLAVAPQLDELIVIARTFTGGRCNPVGNDIGGKVAHFDRVAGSWSFSPTANGSTNELATNLPGSDPDPKSGKIVLFGGGGLSLYDPATRAYTHIADTLKNAAGDSTAIAGTGYANHLVYFPPDDTFYYFARNHPVDVYALHFERDDPERSTVEHLQTTGPTSAHGEPGYDYDAVNHVIGGAVQDSTFYAFDPATRSWSAHPMHGGDPGNMAFHALAYDPVDDAFIFVTDYDSGQHTWAYRLAK